MKPLLVIMILSILLNFVPLSPKPVLDGEVISPPSPVPTTPAAVSATPAVPDVLAEPTFVPPNPAAFAAESAEARARQAMERVLNKYLKHMNSSYIAALEEVRVEGEWAYGVIRWQSKIKLTNGPLHLLAYRSDHGAWQALFPNAEGLYLQWLSDIPENLLSTNKKNKIQSFLNIIKFNYDDQVMKFFIESPTIDTRKWDTYSNTLFGYSIKHPIDLQPKEQNYSLIDNYGGVPSDVHFDEHINIVTRIPPLPDTVITNLWSDAEEVIFPNFEALRRVRNSAPLGGGSLTMSIEYLIRGRGVDYVLAFNPATLESPGALMEQFERMVASFSILSQPNYTASMIRQSANTDGFDFPTDPKDGSTGRAPSYADYDVKNPYLSGWSSCYNKSMSELQHAAEDFFRSSGSNVYAVANGQVVWSKDANYPGAVVIVKHTLPSNVLSPWNGDTIYSVYIGL